MAKAKKKSFPDEVFVYKYDELSDGTPVYAVAVHIGEIPEDCHGENIGIYNIFNIRKFQVRREMD